MNEIELENAITLCIATDLVRCIARNIAGEGVADTLDGTPVIDKTLYGIILTGFTNEIKKGN